MIKKFKLYEERKGMPLVLNEYNEIIISNIKDLLKTFEYDSEYNFNYNFDNVDLIMNCKLSIIIIANSDSIYNGNINAYQIMQTNDFSNVIINIIVKAYNPQIGNIMGSITHELLHVYELYKIRRLFKDDFFNFECWDKIKPLEDSSEQNSIFLYKYFRDLVYYSIKHELRAIISQMNGQIQYTTIGNYKKDKIKSFDKEYLKKLIITTSGYEKLTLLMDFDHENFIRCFNKKETENLLYITNEFNLFFDYKQIKEDQIKPYYRKWEKYFHRIANKGFSKIDDIIDDAYIKIIKYFEEKEKYKDYITCYDNTYKNFSDLLKQNGINSDKEVKEKITEFLNS